VCLLVKAFYSTVQQQHTGNTATQVRSQIARATRLNILTHANLTMMMLEGCAEKGIISAGHSMVTVSGYTRFDACLV
jgi:hypothetical protein